VLIVVSYLLTLAQAFGLTIHAGHDNVRAWRNACECVARIVGARLMPREPARSWHADGKDAGAAVAARE
jgi:hypothetical protein